jgi:CxxC-x17-CxxC domain-containing protein
MSYKKRDFHSGPRRDFNDGPKEMFPAKCADCGNETQVPFKPDESRPVYCKDCFQKHKKPRY